MKKLVNWGKIDRSATILEVLHPRNLAQGETGASKRACGRFLMKTKRTRAEKSGLAMQPVCRDEKVFSCYIVDAWLLISRPSSDLWRRIGTATKTNLTLGCDKTTACTRRVPSISSIQGIRVIHSRTPCQRRTMAYIWLRNGRKFPV